MKLRHTTTVRRKVRARGSIVAMVAAAAALTVGASPVAAFEPPADPNDNFSCEGGPVAGHPGHRGLQKAMTHAASPTAWNAVDNAGPITLCG